MRVDKKLDATGLACAMPIVRTKKMMDTLQEGQILEVVLTDKGALLDIPAWASASGNTVLEQQDDGQLITFKIRKG
ncbi:sulfurtransferase TusA family protein [Kurthia sibirica]|uniref:UPF0033 domain-containing protein n=1 Tax=Kurthia sibirica TaxID=202750 RepID=A0A2U3ANA8_9BACL|nr:sulfurtransferase TusA family protein [Kurthia sibirica]PWI25996.1 hypothetical protein DEX24_05550 [Kurthia sibirica]GEK35286.1 UPF0033 protein YrkI [Kurthia sibirica]